MNQDDKNDEDGDTDDVTVHLIISDAQNAAMLIEACEDVHDEKSEGVMVTYDEKDVNWALGTWAQAKKMMGKMKIDRGFGNKNDRQLKDGPKLNLITKRVKCYNCGGSDILQKIVNSRRRSMTGNRTKPRGRGMASYWSAR